METVQVPGMDPIFSDSRDPMIIFFDSWDLIFNSRDTIRVPKAPCIKASTTGQHQTLLMKYRTFM